MEGYNAALERLREKAANLLRGYLPQEGANISHPFQTGGRCDVPVVRLYKCGYVIAWSCGRYKSSVKITSYCLELLLAAGVLHYITEALKRR